MRENVKINNKWDDLDFFLNKALWSHRGIGKSIPIRRKNLLDLRGVFKKEGVLFFLEGRTLQSVYLHGRLLREDHDDDIGIFEKDLSIFVARIIPILRAEGFSIIRANTDMISIVRDDRYIDICIFRDKGQGRVGYGDKVFSISQYNNLDKILYEGRYFLIPSSTSHHLRERYGGYKVLLKKGVFFIRNFTKRAFRKVFNILSKIKGGVVLTEENFMNLYVENPNAINWNLRSPHMDIVTDNGKYKTVRDIVAYLGKDKNLLSLMGDVKETDTRRPFKNEIHLDRRFWQSGNNFFIYCVKYGFVKNVVPYTDANQYIASVKTPPLYSKEYFESLSKMSDKEISDFLRTSPIEVTNGSVTGGRHRVYAMIGRIINGDGYIPFLIEKKY